MLCLDKANEVIDFIECLKLTDDFYSQDFVLLPWQKELITDVYGTLKENGYRKYRTAYLEISKKNGKSTLIAALMVYHLICDPPAGQLYTAAADREQASIVYKAATEMIEQDEFLESNLKVLKSRKEIININNGTRAKVLSSDAFTKHGLNPSICIIDELHSHKTRDLFDVLTFGAGATRKEPLFWIITTAGDDPDRTSVGFEQHEYSRKVIDGEIIDPTWYAKIYAVPEDADIYDERNWYLANPSLGYTMNIETIRQEANQAKNSESVEKLFRWLRLNQWVALKTLSWLPLTLWDNTIKKGIGAGSQYDIDLTGMKCYIGIDLSATTDLTGLNLLFPPQEGLPFWFAVHKGFIPREKMNERIKRDQVPFDIWVKHGYLYATDGDVIDISFIVDILEAYHKLFQVKQLLADPWNILALVSEINRRKKESNRTKLKEVIEVPQTIAYISPPMKETERLLRKKELYHEDNPVARWCFGNIVIHTDGNENIKFLKDKSKDRIDLMCAQFTAMSSAMSEEKPKVYERRGMRTLND